MKELTIEEKYNIAIEQAKKELKVCGNLDCDAARQIFRLFPELQESDECVFDAGSLDDAHLWTIQDAREGDVLVTNSNIIFIFKFLDEGGTIAFHTSCTKNSGVYFPKLKEQLCDQDVYPATKEQRDLLFQKMKESGYEWDADKKQLKKIEQTLTLSEDDKRMINSIIKSLDEAKWFDIYQVDWLRSLKERMEE